MFSRLLLQIGILLEKTRDSLFCAELGQDRSGGGAVFDAELGEDVFNVLLDGAPAQLEDHSDLEIAFALGEPLRDFAFAGGQVKLAV